MPSFASNEPLEDINLNSAPVYDVNGGDRTAREETKPVNNAAADYSHTGFSAKWTEMVKTIHRPLLKGMQSVTSKAAYNPRRTILAVVVLSALLFVGGLFTNFEVATDDDTVWTPAGARPVSHGKWIDNESGFPEDARDFLLIFHSDGNNVIGQDQVGRIFQALDAVRALEGYDTVCANSTYTSRSGESTCEITGVTNFWNDTVSIYAEQVQSDNEAIETLSAEYYPDGTPVAELNIMGYPVRDSSGLLTSAQMFTVIISLPESDASEKFESKALDIILDIRKAWKAEVGNSFKVEVAAERSFEDEFGRAIVDDLPLIPLVFVIMSIFTALIFVNRKSKVQSRSLLGFSAVVAVLLSILSGFGLLFVAGVPFTAMTQILPFVIFGVGLDDAFIISGSYSRTDPAKEPEERIRDTIEDIGISITLTTVTSTIAFGLGCLSTIPTVYWLCLYAFPTIAFVYLYQLTFFVACIVLDEHRIKEHRRDCCTWITVHSNNEEKDRQPESTVPVSKQHALGEKFMGWYAGKLLNPWVKAVVVLVFTALLIVCALSASELRQQFRLTDVVPNDSYLVPLFDALDDFRERSSVAPYVYFRFVDQSSATIQEQMDGFVNELVNIDAIEYQPDFFWLRDFKLFVEDSGDEISQLDFNNQIDAFLSDPVYDKIYRDDIVRDASGTITSSRCLINMDNTDLDDVNLQIDALEDQRAVTKAQPVNQGQNDWAFFTFSGNYNIWEFYAVSAKELALTTILGVVAVTGVALFLIPHWTAALFTLPMIAVLYINLLGIMQLAGIDVNPVSYIALVMAIGLLVDYLIHPMLKYYESSGTRKEKTTEMLTTMGNSVLIGGISTFLGTLPLAFSASEIFTTIFVTFMGLVTLGCGHGLILLPVILSTIGPEDKASAKSSLKHQQTSVTVSDVERT